MQLPYSQISAQMPSMQLHHPTSDTYSTFDIIYQRPPSRRSRTMSLQATCPLGYNSQPSLLDPLLQDQAGFQESACWNPNNTFNTFYASGAPPTPTSPAFPSPSSFTHLQQPYQQAATDESSLWSTYPPLTALGGSAIPRSASGLPSSTFDAFSTQAAQPFEPFSPTETAYGSSRRASLYQSPATIHLPNLDHLPPPTVRRASEPKGAKTRTRRLSVAPAVKSLAAAPSAPLKRKKSTSKLVSARQPSSTDKRFPPLPSLPLLQPIELLPPLPPLTSTHRSYVSNPLTPVNSMAPVTIATPRRLSQQSPLDIPLRRPRRTSVALPNPETGLPALGSLHRPEDYTMGETLHAKRYSRSPNVTSGAISPTTPQRRELLSGARKSFPATHLVYKEETDGYVL